LKKNKGLCQTPHPRLKLDLLLGFAVHLYAHRRTISHLNQFSRSLPLRLADLTFMVFVNVLRCNELLVLGTTLTSINFGFGKQINVILLAYAGIRYICENGGLS
jgi:hypothetical protein